MQDHQQQMKLMLFGQNNQATAPPKELHFMKLEFPKWNSKVAFVEYQSRVEAFVYNVLPSLAGKLASDPACVTSYQ